MSAYLCLQGQGPAICSKLLGSDLAKQLLEAEGPGRGGQRTNKLAFEFVDEALWTGFQALLGTLRTAERTAAEAQRELEAEQVRQQPAARP